MMRLVLSLSAASRKSSQPRAKEEKVNLDFVNDEGRPSTLRHSNLSFRSNISSVFEFQKRVELLIFVVVLNRAVIFENISKFSFGPRQNMFRWKSYCTERYSFFHSWQSFSFSHHISSAVSFLSKYHSFEKLSVTFKCFFCFLWNLFLSELICWEKQLYELWSPEIFHFSSTVVPSAKKIMQNFRWILFEGTRGKQLVQVFWNDPAKLSFSG